MKRSLSVAGLFAVLSKYSQRHSGNDLRPALFRWMKFNAVGAIGIAVQLSALGMFRSGLHLDYMFATASAVEMAVLHNFCWHERYTWADRRTTRPAQWLFRLVKFNASNGAVSLIGNLVLMRLLVAERKVNYFIANVIAIVVCSLANFLLGDRFVFEKGAAEGPSAV